MNFVFKECDREASQDGTATLDGTGVDGVVYGLDDLNGLQVIQGNQATSSAGVGIQHAILDGTGIAFVNGYDECNEIQGIHIGVYF